MKTWAFTGTLCCVLVFSGIAFARHHHQGSSSSSGEPGSFDYYLLSLSWAPSYCHDHPGDHSSECTVGKHAAFVLHGLWPQANTGQRLLSCAPASPVSAAIVTHMLQFFPSSSLIQHEWQEHGTCSGLSTQDYFNTVEQAFTHVQVPDQFRDLDYDQTVSVREVEQSFADANHAPSDAFRISCHSRELVNLEVCLTKDLQFQACTATAQECPSRQVEMEPVE
jgi:ribonuclease T2